MAQGQSLIAELEDAIHSGSKDKRVDTLRRITDLFVADADRLEPMREVWIHDEAFAARRLSMMRIMARRTKAATVIA